MKLKIIHSPQFVTNHQKQSAIYTLYLQYFPRDLELRKSRSRHIWEQFRLKHLLTVDSILLAINDDVIFHSRNEITTFLKTLRSSAAALSGILDILQDKEDTWETIDFDIPPDRITLLSERLERERELAKSCLKKNFYEEPGFLQLVVEYCSTLITKLENSNLRQLLLTNPGATQLLVDKHYSQKFATVLSPEDAVNLFVADKQLSKEKILVLLKFFAQYRPGSLDLFFRLLNASETDQTQIDNPEQIKKKLLKCGDELLNFLTKYPDFFVTLVVRVEFFLQIIDLAPQAMQYITKLIKVPFIANWVGGKLLLIVAGLLGNSSPTRTQEIVNFLTQYSCSTASNKKKFYSEVLSNEVKGMVRHLSEYGVVELDALFFILENKRVREILKLNAEDYQFLLNHSATQRQTEKIIVTDNALWNKLYNSLQPLLYENSINLRARFLFFYSYWNLEYKTKVQSVTYYHAGYMDSHSAFLLANGTKWDTVRKVITQTCPEQVEKFHPILRLRQRYDTESSKKAFKDYLLAYLAEEGCCLMLGQHSYLELYCDLGSGYDYVFYLSQLTKLREPLRKNSIPQLDTDKARANFLKLIVSNQSFVIKFAAVLNSKIIPGLAEILKYEILSPWIDCNQLVDAILSSEKNGALRLLAQVAVNQDLVVKLLEYCEGNGAYTKKILYIFKIEEAAKLLLSHIESTHFLTILKHARKEIVAVLFGIADEKISEALISCVNKFLFDLQNKEVLLYIFNEEKYIQFLTPLINIKWLVRLLLLPVVYSSQEVMISLLKHYEKLPLNELSSDSSVLVEILEKNKYFAEIVFEQWPLFLKLNLPLETLYTIASSRRLVNTINYMYAQNENSYFFLMQRAFARIVSPPVRELVEYYKSNVTYHEQDNSLIQAIKSPQPLSLEDNVIAEKLRNLLLLEHAEGVFFEYKDLTGLRALALKILHLQLHLNIDDGVRELSAKIIKKECLFSVAYFPPVILLNDQCYQFCLTDLLSAAPEQLLCFLNSLFHDYKDIAELFNLDDALKQITFVRLACRLKQLTIQTLSRFVSENPYEELPLSFMQLLSGAALNYFSTLYQLLEEKNLFRIIFSFIYLNGNFFHYSQGVGEVLLRMLLLKFAISKGMSKEVIDIIIFELQLHSVSYTERQEELIRKLFPLRQLIAETNEQVVSYFLKQPFYVIRLDSRELQSIINNYPQLRICFITYPHLYQKLNREDFSIFITDFINLQTPLQIAKRLSMSLLTERVVKDHPFFAPIKKNETRLSTTCQLFSKLEIKENKTNGQEVSAQFVAEDNLVKCLQVNPYLPFQVHSADSRLLEDIRSLPDEETRLQIMMNLVILITETTVTRAESEKLVTQTIAMLNKYSKDPTDNSLPFEEWQSLYQKHWRLVQHTIEEVIEEGLTQVSGVKKIVENNTIVSTAEVLGFHMQASQNL